MSSILFFSVVRVHTSRNLKVIETERVVNPTLKILNRNEKDEKKKKDYGLAREGKDEWIM